MSTNKHPIAGTPDSYLVLNVLPDPENTMEYLSTLITPSQTSANPNNNKPHALFYSEKDPESGSLYYLRCPSIRNIIEYTPEIRNISNIIDPNANIVKVLKYSGPSKALKAHADKTIDLADNIPIYTLRLGTPRTTVLQHKVTGEKVSIEIPHNAMFVLGLKTNASYTHAVLPANAGDTAIADTQDTYSIVLRKSITLKDAKSDYLWGPRTPFPTYNSLQEYLASNGTSTSTTKKSELVALWGIENRQEVDQDHYKGYCSQIAKVFK